MPIAIRVSWVLYVRTPPLLIRNAGGQKADISDEVDEGVYTLRVRRPGRANLVCRFQTDDLYDGLELREPSRLRRFVAEEARLEM